MPGYDYKKLKKEMDILEVDSREELPPGLWVGIEEAARLTGLTKMAIRYRALRGDYQTAKIRSHPMLIKLELKEPDNEQPRESELF